MKQENWAHDEDLSQWHAHQYDPEYDPGYYTGCNIDPSLTVRGSPTLLAVLFIMQTTALAAVYFFAVLPNAAIYKLSVFIVVSLFFAILFSMATFLSARYVQLIFERRQGEIQEDEGAPDRHLYENKLPLKRCPSCGAEQEIDYLKCPNCKHSYEQN